MNMDLQNELKVIQFDTVEARKKQLKINDDVEIRLETGRLQDMQLLANELADKNRDKVFNIMTGDVIQIVANPYKYDQV